GLADARFIVHSSSRPLARMQPAPGTEIRNSEGLSDTSRTLIVALRLEHPVDLVLRISQPPCVLYQALAKMQGVFHSIQLWGRNGPLKYGGGSSRRSRSRVEIEVECVLIDSNCLISYN